MGLLSLGTCALRVKAFVLCLVPLLECNSVIQCRLCRLLSVLLPELQQISVLGDKSRLKIKVK
jgi:hypothetical protein